MLTESDSFCYGSYKPLYFMGVLMRSNFSLIVVKLNHIILSGNFN